MPGDSLGDRMKRYEDASRYYLPDRMPVIIRLDGKAFHTWTRGLERPYCQPLMEAMDKVAIHVLQNIQNAAMAYVQSDEISILVVNFRDIKTTPWFDNNLQKMVSVSAALASSKMTVLSSELFFDGEPKPALFDARAFVMPILDVENYMIWRQKDWQRNSIQMLARSLYSHKELHKKSTPELHEMCFQKGHNWARDYSSQVKDGRVILKGIKTVYFERGDYVQKAEWGILETTPIFTTPEGRMLVRNLMKLEEPEKIEEG